MSQLWLPIALAMVSGASIVFPQLLNTNLRFESRLIGVALLIAGVVLICR